MKGWAGKDELYRNGQAVVFKDLHAIIGRASDQHQDLTAAKARIAELEAQLAMNVSQGFAPPGTSPELWRMVRPALPIISSQYPNMTYSLFHNTSRQILMRYGYSVVDEGQAYFFEDTREGQDMQALAQLIRRLGGNATLDAVRRWPSLDRRDGSAMGR